MITESWEPSPSVEALRKRAELVAKTRQFFAERGVLEVDTPVMAHAPVTDPYLNALQVKANGQMHYLQTSPEYAMKRLLAAGSGSIYQLGKAFRDDEWGKLHSPEFTMLEWYQVGMDDQQLMQEVSDYLQAILQCMPSARVSYQACFETHCGINPHEATVASLTAVIHEQGVTLHSHDGLGRDDYLQLLFSACIEPNLGHDQPVLVYDYPQTQAALARHKWVDGQVVAARFELYFQGIELANGYHELTDLEIQLERFQQDLAVRKQQGLTEVPIDQKLLGALQQGLPDCAGVALGFDRLMMLALGHDQISDTLFV